MSYSIPASLTPPLANFLPNLESGNDITSPRQNLVYANQGAGYVYFQANFANLDDDGSGTGAGDSSHQSSLSIGDGIDANQVSYGVLPYDLAKDLGIKLGDVGVAVRNGIAITMFLADHSSNPGETDTEFTGELSLFAFRELGEERIKDDGTIENEGMSGPVGYIWFPGSAPKLRDENGWLPLEEFLQAIHDAAVPLATSLGVQF